MSSRETDAKLRTAALHKLFIRHTSALRGYLMAILPNDDAVDDILHNTFLAINAKADQFDESRDFAAWARGIARYELLRYKRDCARAPRSLSAEVIEKLSVVVPLLDDTDEHRSTATSECVDELASRAKQFMRLRYSDGIRLAEIARRMDVAVGTVKATLARSRSQVRECVQRKLGTKPENRDGS